MGVLSRQAEQAVRALTKRCRSLLAALLCVLAMPALAAECPQCLEAVEPFKIHGNTYYVGTRGLSAILITSGQGHILIDGGLPQMAPMIADQIQTLGFSMRDVKLIVNSHAHLEHAGGLAELARESSARLAMSPWNADAVRTGTTGSSDPQADPTRLLPKFGNIQTVRDGEALTVGTIFVRARFTPGHTPGGTTWTWQSCENDKNCIDVVYADTLTPDAKPGFKFHDAPSYPQVLQDFARSFTVLESMPCDMVLSPYPDIVAFWQRRELQQEQQEQADAQNPFIEDNSCRKYAEVARGALERRLAEEQAEAKRR